MPQDPIQTFSSAVDKMLLACNQNPECKEILIGKLAQKQQQQAFRALEDTITQTKSIKVIDESDIDIKDYRAIQDAVSTGQYEKALTQCRKMDTAPRENIPSEVDEWIETCKSLYHTI